MFCDSYCIGMNAPRFLSIKHVARKPPSHEKVPYAYASGRVPVLAGINMTDDMNSKDNKIIRPFAFLT